MTELQADAIVLFGATGDLAFKKIFPALQAMIKQGHLTVPVIGVAKANRTVDQLRDRARESLGQFGGGAAVPHGYDFYPDFLADSLFGKIGESFI